MAIDAAPASATLQATIELGRCLVGLRQEPVAVAVLQAGRAIVSAFGPLVERALTPNGYTEFQIVNDPAEVNRAIAQGWEFIALAAHVGAAPEYHLGRRAS